MNVFAQQHKMFRNVITSLPESYIAGYREKHIFGVADTTTTRHKE